MGGRKEWETGAGWGICLISGKEGGPLCCGVILDQVTAFSPLLTWIQFPPSWPGRPQVSTAILGSAKPKNLSSIPQHELLLKAST